MTVSRKRKDRIIFRDGGLCQLNLFGCTVFADTADHRANRGAGGSQLLDDGRNLIAACNLCNMAKENATGAVRADLIRRGLRVVPAATHAATRDRAIRTLVQGRDGQWRELLSDTAARVVGAVERATLGPLTEAAVLP